jgi:hypothetical protein
MLIIEMDMRLHLAMLAIEVSLIIQGKSLKVTLKAQIMVIVKTVVLRGKHLPSCTVEALIHK